MALKPAIELTKGKLLLLEMLDEDKDSAYVYGIDLDTSIATSASNCKRVVLNHDHDQAGDALRYTQVNSFNSMPAHDLRRCVMSNLATREIAYYLNPSDSTKKLDGSAADLTGGDGDVMVHIPIAYVRLDAYYDASSHLHEVYLISDKEFTGAIIHPYFFTGPGGATARDQFVGAFRSVVCDSTGVAKSQSAAETPVGLGSTDIIRSVAGARPGASITRANFRAGSVRNGGTNVNTLFPQYLHILMAIDGCNFNTQEGISIGYSNASEWHYAAVRNTGRTAIFGNGTGEIEAVDAAEGDADYDLLTMKTDGTSIWNSSAAGNHKLRIVQFSYRGIEDPFGSQWCFEDGIQKNQDAVTDDYTKSGYWITNDTSLYSRLDSDIGYGSPTGKFPDKGYTGNSVFWIHHPWPKANGYIKNYDYRTFFTTSTGGGSNTYLGDYFYNDANAGARVVYRGSALSYGALVGLACVHVHGGLGYALANFGARLAA